MRWYVVTLLLIAFLVGTLFKATEQTGMRIWNMFATMGIVLFGLVGSMALTRLQRRSGLKHVEAALKRLEPEWVITDWAGQGGDRPDYLLVGPNAVALICVDEMAGSTFAWRARQLVERSRRKAIAAAEWVRSQLGQPGVEIPGGAELPVQPLVLLSRRKALPEYSADGVTVVNADQMVEHLRSGQGATLVDQPTRFRLTRFFRESHPAG